MATRKVSGLPPLSCSCPPEGGDEPPAGSQMQDALVMGGDTPEVLGMLPAVGGF